MPVGQLSTGTLLFGEWGVEAWVVVVRAVGSKGWDRCKGWKRCKGWDRCKDGDGWGWRALAVGLGMMTGGGGDGCKGWWWMGMVRICRGVEDDEEWGWMMRAGCEGW